MKSPIRIALACLLTAASSAFAYDVPAPCEQDPKARGLAERLRNIRGHMERIEATRDAGEQRVLMDLHMKTMHEGLRELRRRDTTDACRMEVMHGIMEQMLRHQLVANDAQ